MGDVFGMAICGLGAAGAGVLVAAAQQGSLDELLGRGVLAVDRAPFADLGGTLPSYRITANSMGGAFLECLDGPAGDTLLAGLSKSSEAARLRRFADVYPPLSVVGPFVSLVARRVAEVLEKHPRCWLRTETSLEALDVMDGSVALSGAEAHLGRARRVVLTLGGEERVDTEFGLVASAQEEGFARIVIPSGDVVRGRAFPSDARRVTILGGSHSAWGVAAHLERRLPDVEVVIVQRAEPPLFYPSVADADTDGYRFDRDKDVCPLSGRVHRYGGLRGPARALARRLRADPGAVNVRSVELPTPWLAPGFVAAHALPADVLVPALGYRARLPAVTRNGQAVQLLAKAGAIEVAASGVVRDEHGAALPGLLAFGLGAGLRPSPGVGGEPSYQGRLDGVWLYQHDAGYRILRELRSEVPDSKDGE